MPIYNATRHRCTQEQLELGIIDLPQDIHDQLVLLGTFKPVPTMEEVLERAREATYLIFMHISGINPYEEDIQVMIGGAPYFTSALENALIESGYEPCYPFYHRTTVDGKVTFIHRGLV